VADFGLANAAGLERLTTTGQMVGTPSHMAPEQVDGAQPAPTMDVWALGVVLYEALTGELPFEADSLPELIGCILEGTPRPPSVEVPAPLLEVSLCALRVDPGQRFPHGDALADAIEAALHGRRPGRRLRLPPWQRVVPAFAVIALVLVALLHEPAPAPAPAALPPARPAPLPPPPPKPEAPAVAPLPLTLRERVLAAVPPPRVGDSMHVSEMRRLAVEDLDLSAICKLGMLYLQSVPTYTKAGLRLLEIAADEGHPRAQGHLGGMLLHGKRGLQPDPARGVELIRAGVAGDDYQSMLSLARLHLDGTHVPLDRARAIALYEAVGDRSSSSLVGLGSLYERGYGEPPDLARAAKLYRRAASNGRGAGYSAIASLLHQHGIDSRPELKSWLLRGVLDWNASCSTTLARSLMGQDWLKKDKRRAPWIDWWGAPSGKRNLRDELRLTLDGAPYTRCEPQTQRTARFRMRGDMARLWLIWHPAGRVEPPTDLLNDADQKAKIERTREGQAIVATEATFTSSLAQGEGFRIFVAEDRDGRLSNLAFLEVVR
jgi:TPR repeat protein